MRIRTYSELRSLRTFEERFEYLKLQGTVGHSTFGYERHLNQRFYTSTQWRHTRDKIITRDLGTDLGVDGYEVYDRIVVHHMNPMLPEDIIHGDPDILNHEYLIATSHNTHNAIHYGDASLLVKPMVERRPGDTRLW